MNTVSISHFASTAGHWRIVGSVARGDSDAWSDLDVLVAVEEPGSVDRTEVTRILTEQLGSTVEASFYSIETLKRMWKEGHLFAWHVWLDSRPNNGEDDVFSSWGVPSPPVNSVGEAEDLLVDLLRARHCVQTVPQNWAYELSIGFICVRNIGIHLGWYTPSGLTFSRYAPFLVGNAMGLPFPLSKGDYNRLFLTRRACAAGKDLPPLNAGAAERLLDSCSTWAASAIEHVRRTHGQ